MALEITKNIDVDFYNKEYILINAKQYDANSRVISITCYNQGELMRLSDSQHSVYVRYRKADGHPVLNSCRINNRGQVLVWLTEQMLAAAGVCYVDLIIVNKGDAIVNTDTGEILAIDDYSILSTMAFYINTYEASVSNSEIESSYEYEGLNDLIQRAEKDYTEVMLTSKSWAVGNTGIRDGENTDNSKYYSQRSSNSASASSTSASNAANSAANAETYMNNALEYMNTAKSHMDEAKASEDNARTSEDNALNSEVTTKSYMETTDGYMKTTEEYMNTVNGYMTTTQGYMSTTEGYMTATDGYMDKTEEHMTTAKGHMDKTEEFMNTTDGYMDTTKGYMETSQGYMNTTKSHMDNAETYMNNAETSMNNAKTSETNAANSEENAKTSETNASVSEDNAFDYSVIAQRYAVGGTGTVSDEEVDNAKYYYQQVKGIQDSISGTLSPQGTVSFEELATVEKFTGYMYLIDESFTTDATFTDGEGVQYPAGTLVFYTSNGLWSCLDSFGSSVATVDEVVEYLGLLM